MKTVIGIAAAVISMLPLAAGAQSPEPAVKSRTVVRIVQQTQAERRVQERLRESQQRQREAQERARERNNQSRRDDREEQTEKISRTLKIGGNGELDLSTVAGDITVTRGGGNVAQLEVIKVARGRTVEEARQMLSAVTVDVAERGSRAEVSTRYPDRDQANRQRRSINVTVQYTLTAPENTTITANSISGSIRITDIKGDVNAESISGDVIITNGARVMTAKSTSGNVEITNLESQIGIEAGTVSGNLVVRQARVPRVELTTVSGNLVVENLDCGRVDVTTVTGNIDFTSALARNGRYELSSHSGVIRFVPTGNTGFSLDADSFSGDIRSEVTLKDQKQGGADYRRRGPGGRTRSLSGTFGDGGAMLEISTFSGSVVIGKK